MIVEGSDEANKVVEFVQPQVLEERLDVQLESKACSTDSLIAVCKDIVQYSVKTGHPMFFNQLYQGIPSLSVVVAVVVVVVVSVFVVVDTFLDAPSHLYKRLCPSVRRSVGPSVRPYVPCYFRG